MRALIFALTLLAAPAWAQTPVSFTLPADTANAETAQVTAECDAYRQERSVPASTWSLDICAKEVFREWVEGRQAKTVRQTEQAKVGPAIDAQIAAFRSWLSPETTAICGDLVYSPEFGEECDDSQKGPRRPCKGNCRLNYCGDGKVCDLPVCGTDGRPGVTLEECDLGNQNDDAGPSGGCTTTCTLIP